MCKNTPEDRRKAAVRILDQAINEINAMPHWKYGVSSALKVLVELKSRYTKESRRG
jgi:hypothetical protein